jgi:hypothetical protein
MNMSGLQNNHGWSERDVERLRRLAATDQLFFSEIADRIGKKPAAVRWKAKKLGIRRPARHRLGKSNSKHSHLRERAMRYFLKHTFEETQKKFGLTKSEFKSLMTVSYRDPNLKHLRKETREHSPWSTEQLKFLLTHAGLKNRDFIAKEIGRGNRTCIKERMQKLGIASRNIQGITLSQFIKAFGHRPDFYIMTSAGPDGGKKGGLPTRWKIIPWVWLYGELKSKRLKTAPEFYHLVKAMALFQEWIFEGDALNKMQAICVE